MRITIAITDESMLLRIIICFWPLLKSTKMKSYRPVLRKTSLSTEDEHLYAVFVQWAEINQLKVNLNNDIDEGEG